MRTLTVAAILSLALPAQAHDRAEIEAYEADWAQRFAAADSDGEPVIGLLTERRDFLERHDWFWNPPAPVVRSNTPPQAAPSVHRGMGGNVEVWRPLVSAYFGDLGEDTVNMALRVMSCESGGNQFAANPRSSARGLMQIMASVWAAEFGVTWDQLYDPDINLRIARQVYERQGWNAWTCWR